ncbi:hypothetical protein ACI8AF_08275 [Blastococcus sp. SYSU D00669]
MSDRLLSLVRIGVALALLLTLGLADHTVPPPPGGLAPAADISQFNPGHIVSDSVFFDGDAMTAAEIQNFLDVKGANCRPGSDGTPCLKNYRQDTTDRPADSFCAGYAAAPQETAAAIIAKVGLSCNISPKALLVILQKEQGLVTISGDRLYARRYREAMGFACPDTAPCDPAYNGFQNQVYSAARQFQRYAATPASFGYRAGRTNTILWNPNTACGSSQVYIQNQATAGLYIYTPYRPNAAALAAGYGTGDACSAYGNRNFWLYFTDWFGSTYSPGESPWQPIGHLDSVTAASGDRIEVLGWAVDPDTTAPISVHVYVDGGWAGAVTADVPRPDIGAYLPSYGERHGFSLPLTVPQGRHTVCAFAINVGYPAVNPSIGCLEVDTGHLPLGNIEQAFIDEGQAVLTGWTLDPDTTGPIDVHAYVNGQLGGYGTAGLSRPDVAAAYPGAGDRHGFSIRAFLQPGDNQICLFAINVPTPAVNPSLGCRSLHLRVDPIGTVDEVTSGPTSVTVTGWALDPETRSPIDVKAVVDGVEVVRRTAGDQRPDVAANYPESGPRHGYSFTVPLAPGTHQFCVYAVNVGQGSTDPLLGCRDVNVGVPPIGHLDEAVVSSFQARVQGWALDPDTSAPIDVHVLVDGRLAATVTASGDRPDIGAAFPATGPAHGFTATVPVAAGRHTICAYAVNVLGGNGTPGLGCYAVQVAAGQSRPFGQLDQVSVEAGIVRATGWVVEPDAPTAPVMTHFYVDGRLAGYLHAGEDRPDVAAAFPGVGPAHGYTGYFILSPGRHTVCTYGINQGVPDINPQLGCRAVTVP